MDLRLRLAARMFLAAENLRVAEAGREQMLAELASTDLTDQIASLASSYGLKAADLAWQETLESEGPQHNRRFATY
jgi:hypothetical protein